MPQDPKAASGYVNEEYAIELIESAGFRLVGALGDQRQSQGHQGLRKRRLGACRRRSPTAMWTATRYAAIGESDRFTLKFVKVAQ